MLRTLSATLVVCAFFVAAAVASAVEPGVHVDPGSPSGKQYALPFDQARHGAGSSPSAQHPGGGGAAGRAPSAADSRFGQGITPARAGRAPRGNRGNPPQRPDSGAPRAPGTNSSSRRTPSAHAALPTPAGSSSNGWVLGGTGAVVLLSGALALALRRRGAVASDSTARLKPPWRR